MVTYVYICRNCEGPERERIFECEYEGISAAAAAPMPECPRCGVADGVSRYFGHSIFGPTSKSAVRDHNTPPSGFIKFQPGQQGGKGILSIGVRADEEVLEKIHRRIKQAAEDAGGELIEAEPQSFGEMNPAQDEDGEPEQEADLTEEVLGLTPGTMERTLFDIRQRQLIEDLENGSPFSGFFMPLSEGEYFN